MRILFDYHKSIQIVWMSERETAQFMNVVKANQRDLFRENLIDNIHPSYGNGDLVQKMTKNPSFAVVPRVLIFTKQCSDQKSNFVVLSSSNED